MQAIIRYDTWQDYGFKEQQTYSAEVKIENEEVVINFQFPEKAKGLSKNSSVEQFAFSFTKDEANQLVAVLNGILHHPEIKDKAIKWEKK